ncbi:bifunctional glycosyltransferase family 2/GtrA family protein [Anaerocolumna xylanovorans]|uniref:Glycosyltransferase involved in cell wall bisynthesis n=1 Tax=Anaerocolumna xylanovorans DSM 12503 TaxID=1121345 RepID=A0A1M7YC64_9FIRM|nr:bifunctional glycosyltransferase family 2/GtrA family protein [Anaerocolumna xylanovorans]SHO50230.1 Glycosyltransferase involved in cell wall bisynthesis [Anaerocolumna xylanovorans DSM 12503]
MGYLEEVAVIIPSLNPDEKMLCFIQQLKETGFKHILVVNDGSSTIYEEYYRRAKETYGCNIFKHGVNLGKGRALKDAFNYILTGKENIRGVVTVDSDGQHSAVDTLSCAKALWENPDALIMGCRSFEDKTIPFRSRAGNKITCKVLNLLCGIKVSDTQTGLRGMSTELLEKFMTVSGERFEYEMNMLLAVREYGISVIEVPIETIYLEDNKSSHFNPLLDSLRIYSLFVKFLAVSLASFFVDILLFILFSNLTRLVFPVGFIMVSTVAARIISSFVNFSFNRSKVFGNTNNGGRVFVRYFALCIVQMLLSAFLVTWLYSAMGAFETLIKVFVDSILFFISYQVQMKWVFRNTNVNNIQELKGLKDQADNGNY